MADLTETEEARLEEGEAVYNMTQTKGWKYYAAALNHRLESSRSNLERCDLDKIQFVRGEVEGLREALRLVNAFITHRAELLEKLERG